MVCDQKFQIFWAPFPSPLSHKIPLKGSPKYFQFQVFHFFSKLEKGAMLGMSPDNFVSKEHQQMFACCYIWVPAYSFVEFPWFVSSSGLGENVGKSMFNWSVHLRPSLFLLCKLNWHMYIHVWTFCPHSQVHLFSQTEKGHICQTQNVMLKSHVHSFSDDWHHSDPLAWVTLTSWKFTEVILVWTLCINCCVPFLFTLCYYYNLSP